ncbi:MAG: tetratricopeptide repeat protein [Rhodospirillaceae bacterium]|nr:tetratricopeptide repeat protein [Rhodospirillaceae bacterium]
MKKATQHSPTQIAALIAEAVRNHQNGALAMAEVQYRQALASEPSNYAALHMLAVIGYQTNQFEESIKLFRQAESQGANDPSFLVNYGATLKSARRFEEALEKYDRALAIKPDNFEALYNKAQLLNELKRYDEAIEVSKQCMAIRPDDSDAITSYGIALKNMGRWIEALDRFDEAITVNPESVFAHICMGEVLRSHGWLNAGDLFYKRALDLDPRNPVARTHRAVNALMHGRLEDGWKEYDGRFWYLEERVPRRPVPPVYWGGEDLTGKSLLIWTEQGIGDAIIYSSMILEIAARARAVYLECEPRLVPIFSRSFPGVQVFTLRDGARSAPEVPIADYQSAIGSLGRFMRPTLDSFPRHNGYLVPDKNKVAEFKRRYAPGPVVGISWRSSKQAAALVKSVPLLEWAPILRVPGIKFVNLQYGDNSAEIEEVKRKLGVEIIEDSSVNALKDMDGFLAQVAALDLVVSVSNTTVHVAGATNVPVWLALPNKGLGLWYWFQRRADSPWYPSMRIFRGQVENLNILGDLAWWSNIVGRIASDLDDLASRKRMK